MAAKQYSLAPSTWGAGVEVPVDHVSQAALFSDFAGRKGTTYVDVVLEANPLNRSWRVRRRSGGELPGPVLGEVAPEWRAHFDEVERVHSSFLQPATVAAVSLNTVTGRFEVHVVLPEPQLAVPRNNAPEEAAVLLPGDMLVIDTSVGEFSADELAARSPGQWFVGLLPIDGTALATLDGRVLGAIAGPDGEAVLEWLAGFPNGGLWARAVVLDGMAALDAGAPDEGTESIPALSAAPQRRPEPWQLIEFPGGGWAVTVERDFATDPADAVMPKHTARYVSLGGGARPEDIAAPTEMFGRVDEPDDTEAPKRPEPTAVAAQNTRDGYLTEVEKVQLRRKNRKRRRGGRHRR